MTELRRLLDGDSDDLAISILRSADDDSPSADSLKAAALALGISGTLGGSALLASGLRSAAVPSAAASGAHAAVGAPPAATVASITLGAIVKQMAIGVAAGVLAMGGVQLASDSASTSDAQAPKNIPAPTRASAAQARGVVRGQPREPSAQTATLGAEALQSPTQPSLDGTPGAPGQRRRSAAPAVLNVAPATVAEAPAAAAPVGEVASLEPVKAAEPEKAPVALNKSLAAEVLLLDRARNALLAQNPSGALRALDQYRKERQTAILEPEANVLQIQVLEQLGERAAAARLARKFVQAHPASRHAESLRALAAEAP
jgi:hypothetical protein